MVLRVVVKVPIDASLKYIQVKLVHLGLFFTFTIGTPFTEAGSSILLKG